MITTGQKFKRGETLADKNSKYPVAEAVREAYQVGEDDETLEPWVLVDRQGRASAGSGMEIM